MRNLVSVLLTWVLWTNAISGAPRSFAASPESQLPANHKPTLKEQLLEIPAGSIVEVRLKSKEKLRGQLGEVTNDSFTIKHAKGEKIEDRTVTFEEVKSVKPVGQAKARNTVLTILAGVAIGVVVLIVVAVVAYRS